MPGQTFSASATTRARADAIWERLQVPATWEEISGVDEVFDPRFDGSELVGFKFHSTAGGRRYTGTATPRTRDPGQSLGWDIATSELKGWVKVDLGESGEETRVTVTMEVEAVSLIASLGFSLIASAIGRGFQQTVDRFAAELESR